MGSKTNTEREIDLVYTVRVKTYGRKDLKASVGTRLAKLCRLAFNDVEVTWTGKDSESLDVANDTGVTSFT